MTGGQRGQGLVEYGLILVLMALFSIIALVLFGGQISTILNAITNNV